MAPKNPETLTPSAMRRGGHLNLDGEVAAGPMTYHVDGRQCVSTAAGHSPFTFGLRNGR